MVRREVSSGATISVTRAAMGERNFICSSPDCKARYNRAWKLEAHMCKHTGSRPFVCELQGCDKSFVTKYHLARHALSHSGEKPYRCNVEGCTQAFSTNANMKKHVTRRHQQCYVCEHVDCGKSFKKNIQLKAHEYEHTNVLPFQCHVEGCGKRFAVPSKLKRHEKMHEGYPCSEDGCSFLGKTWSEYQKHRKVQHAVKLQCPSCSKVLWDSWSLRQHQRVHQQERRVFCCPRDGCTRTYSTSFNLQSHIMSYHEELRPFTCTQAGCNKTFAMKQSLERHAVVHDPQRKKQGKRRPRRTLASRLSGFQPHCGVSEPGQLVPLLQGASLQGETDSAHIEPATPSLTPPTTP